ncbi:MAG: hypothetical protein CEE40_07615 [Chloroflexi bacterium B3_Chlor]|nr:MAG: hypothetical protein CEE40_07615 [Chloroflexi bacterium B3_Chlor]
MAEFQDTTERRLKWTRRIARALALACAGLWTCLVAAVALFTVSICSSVNFWDVMDRPLRECIGEVWLGKVWLVFTVVLVLWVSAAISWRWQRAGGVALLVEGLLLFSATIGLLIMPELGFAVLGRSYGVSVLLFCGFFEYALLLLGALPIAAGILFLLGWWKSRTPRLAQNAE